MYCIKCGYELKNGDTFCTKYGNNILYKNDLNNRHKAAVVRLVFSILSLLATVYIVINVNDAANELFGTWIIKYHYEEIGFVSLASIVMGIIGLIPSIAEIIDGDKRTIVVITLIISIISLVIIIVTLISIYPIMMK